MNLVKKILRKIVYGKNANSNTYKKWLINQGCNIGECTTFFSPKTTFIDTTRPYLISIGDDVQITHGVTILTHGYDWSVVKGLYGKVLGSAGAVTIGNNVFIGMNATILKGVTVGNNVIIGAGSVVYKNIPNNTVVAGNPAGQIMSIEEYYNKRASAQIDEATELVKKYKDRYNGANPSKRDLNEFFWLFADKNDVLDDSWKHMMKLVGNETFSYSVFGKNEKTYSNIDDFINTIEVK